MDEAIVRLSAENLRATKDIATEYATASVGVGTSRERRPIAVVREKLVLRERVLSEPRLDEAIEIASQCVRVSLSREVVDVVKATDVYEEVALRIDTVRRVERLERDVRKEELIVRETLS